MSYLDTVKKISSYRYDPLEEGSMTPEVDFSKDTLAEQRQSPRIIGGEDVVAGGSKFDGKAGALGAMEELAGGGSKLDAASKGLMASGDPRAIGAALGLQTISSINKSKQQREQNRYLAEVQRVKARQDAIDRLASIGQNLRA